MECRLLDVAGASSGFGDRSALLVERRLVTLSHIWRINLWNRLRDPVRDCGTEEGCNNII